MSVQWKSASESWDRNAEFLYLLSSSISHKLATQRWPWLCQQHGATVPLNWTFLNLKDPKIRLSSGFIGLSGVSAHNTYSNIAGLWVSESVLYLYRSTGQLHPCSLT